MEFWLLVVIGILLIIIGALIIKLFLVQKTAREIEIQFAERLMTETNTLIDISHQDKTMRRLEERLNIELRKLRKERHRFQQGDLELKSAVTNISHDLRTPCLLYTSKSCEKILNLLLVFLYLYHGDVNIAVYMKQGIMVLYITF